VYPKILKIYTEHSFEDSKIFSKANFLAIIFKIQKKIKIWGSPYFFTDLFQVGSCLSKFVFEKSVISVFFLYKGVTFWV